MKKFMDGSVEQAVRMGGPQGMKVFVRSVLAVTAGICSATSSAADLTGRVATLAPFLDTQNQLYVSLSGTPSNAIPDGTPTGTCSNTFAVAQMSDANFKSFIYPLLLAAKATDTPITLRTRGCLNGYPIIVGVDYSPR